MFLFLKKNVQEDNLSDGAFAPQIVSLDNLFMSTNLIDKNFFFIEKFSLIKIYNLSINLYILITFFEI
jgi:hypothetical protein